MLAMNSSTMLDANSVGTMMLKLLLSIKALVMLSLSGSQVSEGEDVTLYTRFFLRLNDRSLNKVRK